MPVLSVADKVIEISQNGHIKTLHLVGGCDGAKPTQTTTPNSWRKHPSNTIKILTLACGKFRFFDKELGTSTNIPGYWTLGSVPMRTQLENRSSLGFDRFHVEINDLPLSMCCRGMNRKL